MHTCATTIVRRVVKGGNCPDSKRNIKAEQRNPQLCWTSSNTTRGSFPIGTLGQDVFAI